MEALHAFALCRRQDAKVPRQVASPTQLARVADPKMGLLMVDCNAIVHSFPHLAINLTLGKTWSEPTVFRRTESLVCMPVNKTVFRHLARAADRRHLAVEERAEGNAAWGRLD